MTIYKSWSVRHDSLDHKRFCWFLAIRQATLVLATHKAVTCCLSSLPLLLRYEKILVRRFRHVNSPSMMTLREPGIICMLQIPARKLVLVRKVETSVMKQVILIFLALANWYSLWLALPRWKASLLDIIRCCTKSAKRLANRIWLAWCHSVLCVTLSRRWAQAM